MASAPRFKIYTKDGEYVGCMKHPDDCAAVVSLYGNGATIRDGHRKKDIVWTEGKDNDGWASDSYDHVADTVWRRVDERQQKLVAKRGST